MGICIVYSQREEKIAMTIAEAEATVASVREAEERAKPPETVLTQASWIAADVPAN